MYGVSTKLIAVWHQGLLANCWVLMLSKWVWILTTLLKSFFGNLLIPFSLGMPRVSSYFLNKFSISSGMKVAASVVFGMTPSLIQSTCHLLRKTGHKAEFPWPLWLFSSLHTPFPIKDKQFRGSHRLLEKWLTEFSVVWLYINLL